MKFFLLLFFQHIFTLDGFRTWVKPHSIRWSKYALLDIPKETKVVKEDDVTSVMSCNERWDIMYRATVVYCQKYCELPPSRCIISFEGHEELNLGIWVSNQQQKYHGNCYGHHQCPPLTEEQRSQLMAIEEFREWTEEKQQEAEGSVVVDFFTKVEQAQGKGD